MGDGHRAEHVGFHRFERRVDVGLNRRRQISIDMRPQKIQRLVDVLCSVGLRKADPRRQSVHEGRNLPRSASTVQPFRDFSSQNLCRLFRLIRCDDPDDDEQPRDGEVEVPENVHEHAKNRLSEGAGGSA